MAEVVLFHHVQGFTVGVHAFASELRRAGHTVHTPDLFEGHTFTTIDEGMKYAGGIEATDPGAFARLADQAVADLPAAVVYAGFSFGVEHAQRCAQTRPGALGALLFHSCFPITGDWAFGPWPAGVPVQIHAMEGDEFFTEEGGDIDAARELVAAHPELAELFLYPGDQHLFTDSSLDSYRPDAAARVLERTLAFLARM
ncbi:MAG: dienelactone hydrolase family protein [Microbacteriaceae bacterium]